MAELDHWHPVLKSEELGDRPAGVRVAGREIVVFRTAGGGLGALPDRCPHRGMRLSLGRVEGDRLVCPYHGWRWAPDGQGQSPGNPRARPCAEHLDAVERLGAIWVKSAGSAAAFPRFDTNGYFEFARLRRLVKAPLELVVDNFIEVEHTATTHAVLGHDLDRMAEVETRTTADDDSVRVYNVGPQRRLPRVLHALYGIPRDVHFVDDWTTWFSPVYTVYDQYWIDPTTRARVKEAMRIVVFFNPVSPVETELFTFGYTDAPPWGRLGLNTLLFPLTRAFVHLEVTRDQRMIEQLADTGVTIQGNALGRFDKALLLARRRIDRIYRGRREGALPLATDTPDAAARPD
jgi:phenylpropionate dioxygenase-like ring-hydroxylating dioxygenase large terminal subunit